MKENRIYMLRKEKNISQEELALALNTTRQAISKWERDESYPDLAKIKDLASFFNVSIDYILGFDVENDNLNEFIKKLDNCIKNNEYSIDLHYIKKMILRYNNNFRLYAYVINYLSALGLDTTPSKELCDLIVSYSKRAISIFEEDNELGIKIDDLHKTILTAYSLTKQYDLVKEYINNNKVRDSEDLEILSEYFLNDLDNASEHASSLYIKSLTHMISTNLIQVLLRFKNDDIKEAYNLSNWMKSFIESIDNTGKLFLNLVYLCTFFKGVCEKHLNLDYSNTLDYLNKNHDYINKNISDSSSIKFYYKGNFSIISIGQSFLEILKEIEESLKNTSIYKDFEEFNKLLGVDINE